MTDEQPPSSTTAELSEYLTRQLKQITAIASGALTKIPDPLTLTNLIVTVLITTKDLTVTGLATIVDLTVTGITTLLTLTVSGLATFTNQIISTRANNTGDGLGQVYLNGLLGNRIEFGQAGIAPPSFNTKSLGTKVSLRHAISATQADYAIGTDTGTFWSSIPRIIESFKWYGGITKIMELTGDGILTLGSTGRKVSTFEVQVTAASSGSIVQFNNIPANTIKITISVWNMSMSGTIPPLIRLGVGSVLQATGYLGITISTSGTAMTSTTVSPTGFDMVNTLAAATTWIGSFKLTSMRGTGSGEWTISGIMGGTNAVVSGSCAGGVNIAGVVDCIGIVLPTTAFDTAMTVSILCEE